MAGATLDHLVSVTIFLAALLLFVSFFNQTIQTAALYQQHSATSTKCSDLLDSIVLNPANEVPALFGLHKFNSPQCTLDPLALMWLNSSTGAPVPYGDPVETYSNMTVGGGHSLLVPMSADDFVNYSSALKMLGITGTYGFQLALTPIVNVSIAEVQSDPLKLSVDVGGISFPLARASVSYFLMLVSLDETYPTYSTIQDKTETDDAGSVLIEFPEIVVNENLTYVFVVYAHVGGLTGLGFYTPDFSENTRVIPFVDSISDGEVLLAHSADVLDTPSTGNLAYNASFVKLSAGDFESQNIAAGDVLYNNPPASITIHGDSGILVIAYNATASGGGGVAVVPWGVGALAFPVMFGGNPLGQEWVATDLRQVLINGVAYQVQLSLWSLQGVQVVG